MKRILVLITILLAVDVVSALSFNFQYGTVDRCEDYEVCVPYHREYSITTGSGARVRVRDLANSYTPRNAVPVSLSGPRVIKGSFSSRFPSRRTAYE